MTASADLRPLPIRDDTFLGVCQAIEEDFGINGNWLRIALGAAVLWNPLGAIAAYLALGAAVALSRLIAPHPVAPPAAESVAEAMDSPSAPVALAA